MGLVDSLAASSAFYACVSEVQKERLPSMTGVPTGAAVPMRSPAKRRRVALRLYTLAASRHVSGGRDFCLRMPCHAIAQMQLVCAISIMWCMRCC